MSLRAIRSRNAYHHHRSEPCRLIKDDNGREVDSKVKVSLISQNRLQGICKIVGQGAFNRKTRERMWDI